MDKLLDIFKKYRKEILFLTIVILLALFIAPLATTKDVKRNGIYTEPEEVALYIKKYKELPTNYITKAGLDYAIKHKEDYYGKVIGGDTYWYNEDLKDYHIKEKDVIKECDIPWVRYDCLNRGKERLIYTVNTNNPKVLYTDDHYETFKEFTSFELNLTANILWIFFGLFLSLFTAFYITLLVARIKSF